MIHVYVGPTLSRDESLLNAPSVRVLPPVRHGDLFDPAVADGDTVVILDGVYHQAPALRHKEILAVLGRGVRVFGAASIGALRAAELHEFGMLGVGAVFSAYVRGDIDGDDEVAVGQEPGGGLRALTWPLVNLRHVLGIAEHEGDVTGETASGLLEALGAVYYPQRTMAAVLAVCRRHGAEAFGAWLAERRRADRHFGDLKRLDALEAVQAALDGPPPGPGLPPGTPWDTGYYRRWANFFATEKADGLELATAHRIAYQQIFDPQFPAVWRTHLDYLSRHPDDGSEGVPLAERMTRLTGEHPGPLPVHAVFRPPLDLRDAQAVARLLAGETAADRATIARYEVCNTEARRSTPGFMPEAVDGEVTRRTLLRLWRCDLGRLEEEAAGRGFRSSADAIEETKHFMAGLFHDQTQAASAKELACDAM
ncbi:TfuA-like protein [Streptomyces sp. A3M-1-3]|uniref:TfuA-like protein n=1 Tax=Streptomyces sp. A3M-1-3 TaxID=2962044 RepID=UPI0020B7CBF2|nr:TfuA-like protein [Streptomyces sp. A3M-1-3]MCP3822103.1 TfuA-like protein [Streptomyces sp. A3M-1-3]